MKNNEFIYPADLELFDKFNISKGGKMKDFFLNEYKEETKNEKDYLEKESNKTDEEVKIIGETEVIKEGSEEEKTLKNLFNFISRGIEVQKIIFSKLIDRKDSSFGNAEYRGIARWQITEIIGDTIDSIELAKLVSDKHDIQIIGTNEKMQGIEEYNEEVMNKPSFTLEELLFFLSSKEKKLLELINIAQKKSVGAVYDFLHILYKKIENRLELLKKINITFKNEMYKLTPITVMLDGKIHNYFENVYKKGCSYDINLK